MYKRFYGVTPRTIGGFFEDVLNNGINQVNEEISSYNAPVNIRETPKSYELHLVAAGLKKEDFKLHIDRNILNISFEQKNETAEKTENTEPKEEAKWIRNEYRMRSFKRSFNLNDKIDATKIAARYADGVLVVTLPKKEVSEPAAHEITVN